MRSAQPLVVVVLAVLLAGCTATAAPEPSVPPMPDPVTITGIGSSTTPLEIPEGAQSLRVDLACSDGLFVVSSGDELGTDRAGQCGGVSHFVLTLPDRPTAHVEITLHGTGHGDGGEEAFAATVAFSADPKTVDAAVAADCDDIGGVYSAITNAENFAELGDAQSWRELVATAVSDLDAMTPSPLLAPQVVVMHDWLAAASEPGSLYVDQPHAVRAAQSIVGQICNDNGSIISVKPGGIETASVK